MIGGSGQQPQFMFNVGSREVVIQRCEGKMPCYGETNPQKLAHVNGDVEYVREGQGRHQCYHVYKHDKEYIKGETDLIKYAWDGKYEKVQE